MGNDLCMGVLCLAKKDLFACGNVLEKVEVAPMAFTVTSVVGLGWIGLGVTELTVTLNIPHLTRVLHPTSRSVRGELIVTRACTIFHELSMLTLMCAVPMMGILSPLTLKM